ncbi:MAG: ribbon-helix-helix domain-containing protein [Rhizobiaceae bacterium]
MVQSITNGKFPPRWPHPSNWSNLLRKHSVTIRGHRTSFSIEDEFYEELLALANTHGKSLAWLVSRIDAARGQETNLSSAIRLHVLKSLKSSNTPVNSN